MKDVFDNLCTPVRVDHSLLLEQRRRARLTTARFARDREDLVEMLAALGLMRSQDPGH